MNPIFIAEIKTQSPYGYRAMYPFLTLMDYAITHGDWVSVHTSALWGGDFATLDFVRKNTCKTILAKGLHSTDDDIKRALDHGADYVLVVDRVPYPHAALGQWKVWENCIFELNNMNLFTGNLEVYPSFKDQKFVYNTRDLRTGLPKKTNDLDTFIKAGVWVCQASGIHTPSDVRE